MPCLSFRRTVTAAIPLARALLSAAGEDPSALQWGEVDCADKESDEAVAACAVAGVRMLPHLRFLPASAAADGALTEPAYQLRAGNVNAAALAQWAVQAHRQSAQAASGLAGRTASGADAMANAAAAASEAQAEAEAERARAQAQAQAAEKTAAAKVAAEAAAAKQAARAAAERAAAEKAAADAADAAAKASAKAAREKAAREQAAAAERAAMARAAQPEPAAAATDPSSLAQLRRMRAGDLRKLADRLAVDCSRCVERADWEREVAGALRLRSGAHDEL